MEIKETEIEGLLILQPTVHGDHRGYFFESYNKTKLLELGFNINFIQDNEALSGKYIFRGFHYQLPPYGQAKLVRVIKGKVLDIVIDIRPNSPTYGQSYSILLSEENKTQFFVPEGFAHGYISLEEGTIFSYKVTNVYNRESEGGINFSDPNLNIDWPIPIEELITSDKDQNLPFFGSHKIYQ